MRITEIITESSVDSEIQAAPQAPTQASTVDKSKDSVNEPKVPFPVPDVKGRTTFTVGEGTPAAAQGSYYAGYLVPAAVSRRRNQAVLAGIQKLCAEQAAHARMRSGSVFVKDSNGDEILDLNFDTARTVDDRLQHSIGVDWAFARETRGLVTGIMAHIYDSLDQLHGKGDRILEVNDDRSGGRWDMIAERLGAYYSR